MTEKRVAMNHALAKALFDAGVQHLDDGGQVQPMGSQQAGGIGGFLSDIFGGQNKYSAILAPQQTTNFQPNIGQAYGQAQQGYGQAQNIQAQQQALANALLSQSQGQGPNPAQEALSQATGQNAAMQAALMASQRGANANSGLMARQAAMQGAGVQQQAAGQAATLQAQQQLAAQQALQAQQQAMAQGNLSEQGLQAGLYGQSMAGQNAQNQAAIQNYNMMQGINSGVSAKNTEAGSGAIGGLLGGVGSILSGGLLGGGEGTIKTGNALMSAGQAMTPAGSYYTAQGGEIPEHLHKMAKIYHPHLYCGGPVDFRGGGKVPGTAMVEGNSLMNDTVPAMVSPGEIVLPRTVTKAENAPDKAAEFVRHLQAKKSKGGYEKIAAAKKGKGK